MPPPMEITKNDDSEEDINPEESFGDVISEYTEDDPEKRQCGRIQVADPTESDADIE